MEELPRIIRLLVLAVPVAWASWTFTHEEVFRNVREFCLERGKANRNAVVRKLTYLCSCEYCLSHWIALVVLVLTDFKMVYEDWRGYCVAFPALVWTANIYMSLYLRLRVDIRRDRAIADTVGPESPRPAA
jgi:hypothetical protein